MINPITVTLVTLLALAVGFGLAACGRDTPPPTVAEKSQTNADDLRVNLRANVKDPVRLQQMLILTDQLALELQAGMTQMETLLAEQDRLYRAYASTPTALDDVGARIHTVRQTYRMRIVHGRCAIAQLATDDEWKRIIDRDLALFGN